MEHALIWVGAALVGVTAATFGFVYLALCRFVTDTVEVP